MKIKAITFHRAHNHGSVLQAYALQTFLIKFLDSQGIDCDYEIIDFFPDVQKRLYSVFKPLSSLKNIIKNVIALKHYKALSLRHKRFDLFVKNHLSITSTYDTEKSLNENPPLADLYISGSDQIWNVRAKDFSPAYFFSFLPKEARRISFAVSFGPLEIDWNKYDIDKYVELLERYDYISTREAGSAENVRLLTGISPETHLDPTFLLTAEDWRKIQSDVNYNNGRYILLYCLEPSKQQVSMAQSISVKLDLPIVVLRYNNKNDWFNPFVKRYDSGPCDFLSYIDNAALVLSSSFHGTAFSIIYNKPFYVFDGMKDNRISAILSEIGLTERSIGSDATNLDRIDLVAPDKVAIEQFLHKSRKVSATYLSKALCLNSYNKR